MTKEKKAALDAAILRDLADPSLLHIRIALRNRVGLNRIAALAVANGLTRRREPKPRKAVVNG